MSQYVDGVVKAISEAKSKKAKVPSLMKMIQDDPELKDFFKMVHEHGFRNQAITLLRERLEKNSQETH